MVRYRFKFEIEGSQELIGDERMMYSIAESKAKDMAKEHFYNTKVKVLDWRKE